MNKEITIDHIELMKKVVGIGKITETENRTMIVCQNLYCDVFNLDWEFLIEKGLVKSIPLNSPLYLGYELTENGFKFLAETLGFEEIVEL